MSHSKTGSSLRPCHLTGSVIIYLLTSQDWRRHHPADADWSS